MLEKILQQWGLLSARDRRVILLGGVGLALILIYFVMFEPAWNGRKQLEAEIPVLRGQLGRIEGYALESRRLSGGAAASTGTDSLAQARVVLEQTLQASGIRDTQIQVVGDMIELRFKSMSYEAWLDWLGDALRQTHLRVMDAQVTRDGAGVASVRVALARPLGDNKGSK